MTLDDRCCGPGKPRRRMRTASGRVLRGTRAEIERIRSNVDDVVRKRAVGERNPAAGLGTGKTALLHRLKQDWSDWSPDSEKPLAVELPIDDLGDPDALATDMRNQIPDEANRRFLRCFRGICLRALKFEIGVDLGTGHDPNMNDLFRPFVLTIDDIQQIPEDRHGCATRMLKQLHFATHGIAVIPVLAGLTDSEDRLDAIGISRLNAESALSLGVLTASDAACSVTRFLYRFRIRVDGNCTGWPDRIFEWSGGCPMRLHDVLRALADELVDNEGDLGQVVVGTVRGKAGTLPEAVSFSGTFDKLPRKHLKHQPFTVRSTLLVRNEEAGSEASIRRPEPASGSAERRHGRGACRRRGSGNRGPR